MTMKVVQQLIGFLSGSAGTGATPMVQAFQALVVHPTIVMAPRMDKLQGPILFLI